jgi:hypothetical protein
MVYPVVQVANDPAVKTNLLPDSCAVKPALFVYGLVPGAAILRI